MKQAKKRMGALLLLLVLLCPVIGMPEGELLITEVQPLGTLALAAGEAEGENSAEEAAAEELMTLLGAAGNLETEGLDLEQLSESALNATLTEYLDSVSGLCFQYPSLFVFQEGDTHQFAASADGKAFLRVESFSNDSNLTSEKLLQALGQQGFTVSVAEGSGCLCAKRESDGQQEVSLYLITESFVHHVQMSWPVAEKEAYELYLPYMMNSLTSDETEQG